MLNAMPEIAVVPLFVSVAWMYAEVEPTFVLVNATLAGETEAVVDPTPVPVRAMV
jgi:hypothetical protein